MFAAYSFALRRADEYVADRAAAQAAGPQHAADALINCELMAAFMSDSDAPALEVGTRTLVPPFHGRAEPQRLQHWLGEVLAMPADAMDTHPSLADRLRALRQEPRVPAPAAESAAQKLLGHKLTSVVEGLARAPGF